MCLSTIIKVVDGKDEGAICDNIRQVSVDGTRLTFIDIIGSEYQVDGKISNVDLIDNKIFVDMAE